jgi:hypothetical protein
MARFTLVFAGLLFVGFVSGCREHNPAYVGMVEPRDGPLAQPDATVGPKGEDASADLRDASADEQHADEPVGWDAGADRIPSGEVYVDGAGPETSLRPETGKPLDGGPDVALEVGELRDVAREREGDGRADVARDASDAPWLVDDGGEEVGEDDGGEPDVAASCPEPAVRACLSPSNPLIGACRSGQQTCSNGAWEPLCKDEVLPANAEVCNNGIDDNCNGLTDEGCVEGCVVVAPSGDDGTADGTPDKPFASIAKALQLAQAADGGAPRPVCVAGGATCGVLAVYELDASLSIPSGARVHGNYAIAGSVLSYCGDTQPPTTTLRLKSAAASVVFVDAEPAPTELAGFSIERPSVSIAPEQAITAISVDGARNVMLSAIFINDQASGDTTYGVVVKGGGQATIVRSAISGGLGKVMAVGVYVDGGSVPVAL